MEAAIDKKTKTIIVNNPSNPCGKQINDIMNVIFYPSISGAVYSFEHLQNIINICEKHQIPIIADEIYADMVNSNEKLFKTYLQIM